MQQEAAAKDAANKRRRALVIAALTIVGLLALGGIVAAIVLSTTKSKDATSGDDGETNGNVGGNGTSQAPSKTPQPSETTNFGTRKQSQYPQQCTRNAGGDCQKCDEGWGPAPGENVDNTLAEGFAPCSLRRAYVYKQSPRVNWGGARQGYANFDQVSATVCADMAAEPAPQYAFFYSRKPNYTLLDAQAADEAANRVPDDWVSRAPFEFLMKRRADDPQLSSLQQGGTEGYITCRKLGLAVPERKSREVTCTAPDKQNFAPPDCSECVEGYGPPPPAENACQTEYVRDFEYRLLPACFGNDDPAQRRRACDGEYSEFVESVPQGSATDAESPLYEYQAYASLYNKILKGYEAFGDPEAMREQGLNPCAPQQSGVICRRSAYVPPSRVETPEQTRLREARPLETRKAERDAQQKDDLAYWNANKSALKAQLESNVQQRVLFDEQTGEVQPGYSGRFVSFYQDEFGDLPLLSAQATGYFDALPSRAQQSIALKFVGPPGTLNVDQRAQVCATRRNLADFRTAIERYLQRTFNESQSWPPRTVPKVTDFSGNEPRLVCL